MFAFLAGVVSFISPCILPLIPGYISLVTNQSSQQLNDNRYAGNINKILFPSILFILGFSSVFVLLGASASLIGTSLVKYKTQLFQISGLFIIVFGLFSLDILKIKQLYKERRIKIPSGNFRHLENFLFGIAFGFGWTPCVGPILASILLYASTAESAEKVAALLFTYSLGLGLPFLITGLAISKSLIAFSWIKNHYGGYKITVGSMLIIVGILMVTNNLFYLNIYGQKIFDLVGLNFWQSF